MKQNVEGWDWKINLIKKRMKKINSEENNENQIWYKNEMKSNVKGWNWNKESIKKRFKIK
jgi:hypothetical protein